ncbi:MAG TPA: ABC transporter permease [Candidatus Krumholzibacteriaceae bacterium]|nr:ABC transporter permease [Candidatus Krumholzibacteriaceae bacterium]
MKTGKMFGMAWENLKKRKLRTSLTTLGVVIGITTIIGLASLGEGLRFSVNQRLQQGFELNVLIVIPGSFTSGLRGFGFSPSDVSNLTKIENVTLVTPMITLPTATVNKTTNHEGLGAFTVGAINFTQMQEMLPQRFHLLPGGHFPNATETNGMVLGYRAATVNDTLIASVGENVTLQMQINLFTNPPSHYTYNETYTITGILAEGGTSGLTNFDYWAFIPLDTAANIQGIGESYQIILVKITDPQISEDVSKAIENYFKNSVTVFVPSSLVRQVDNIINLITIFILAVASISLIVAGVGIMNIMTVSVMERTREIGILKAIGARSRTVLSMFLTETMLIGIIGGIIGIATGYGLSYVLAFAVSGLVQSSQQGSGFSSAGNQSQNLTITPIFSPEWTIIALVFAVVVCVIFGLYPARKAAKLDPVQALRYE